MEERVTVEAVPPVHERAAAGLAGDERATSGPTAGDEGPAAGAAAGHEARTSPHLTGDPAATAAAPHAAASLRERGHGGEHDARQEREGDGPDGRTLDHRDASTARDGRSLRPRRPVVKRASSRG
jgi:hypothetical protein